MRETLRAMIESDAILRAIAEFVSVVVVRMADGVVTKATAAVEALFGYGHGELLGKSIDDLVPDHLRRKHAEHRAAYAQQPRCRTVGEVGIVMGRCKSGEEIPVEIILVPITPPDGEPLVAALVLDRRQVPAPTPEVTP